jgi:hypothetical protein
VLPHLPAPTGGFQAKLGFFNQSQLEKSLVLHCYTQEGSYLKAVPLTVGAQQFNEVAADTLLPLNTSHVLVEGSQRITLTLGIEAQDGTMIKAVAAASTPLSGPIKIIPALQGNPELFFEGVAVVNLGDSETFVDIEYTADHILGPPAQSFPLKPMAKMVLSFEDLFGSGTPLPNYYFQLRANQPLAVLGLAGTKDHRTLWPTALIEAPQYPSVVFTEETVKELQRDPYLLQGVKALEELIQCDVKWPNQCAQQVQLMVSGGIRESYPLQVHLSLQRLVTPDSACLEVVTEEVLTFDTAPLVQTIRTDYGSDMPFSLLIFDHEGQLFTTIEFPTQP